MLKKLAFVAFISLPLVACDVDSAPKESPAPPDASTSSKQSERITCEAYHSNVRRAILDTLNGARFVSLMRAATSVSSLVRGNQDQVMDSYCRSAQRDLEKKQRPGFGSSKTTAPRCRELIETIDKACLLPLVERGQVLDRQCHTTLIALNSVSASDLQQKLQKDDFCDNLVITVKQSSN
jgi:hypothetical protein